MATATAFDELPVASSVVREGPAVSGPTPAWWLDRIAIQVVDSGALSSIQPLPRAEFSHPLGRGPMVELGLARDTVRFQWGQHDQLGSAAFWAWLAADRPAPSFGPTSLEEEVAACLLGGYGVTAEIASAAYDGLRIVLGSSQGSIPSISDMERALSQPLRVRGLDRPVRYRFPHQRASRLHQAFRFLAAASPPADPVELRDWLMGAPGIGPKTASWITRNLTGTDRVAIIDVHIRRAGVAAGFFRSTWRLPQDYALFELSFLAVARLGGVGPTSLDVCIWEFLRRVGRARSAVIGSDHS